MLLEFVWIAVFCINYKKKNSFVYLMHNSVLCLVAEGFQRANVCVRVVDEFQLVCAFF